MSTQYTFLCFKNMQNLKKINKNNRAVAGQRCSPESGFATKYKFFKVHDLDLKVIHVGQDGTT